MIYSSFEEELREIRKVIKSGDYSGWWTKDRVLDKLSEVDYYISNLNNETQGEVDRAEGLDETVLELNQTQERIQKETLVEGIAVKFENRSGAEIVAVFKDDHLYNKCLPVLEKELSEQTLYDKITENELEINL